ncbi:putative Transmembrane protein [Hibiscus syriacus]|uniref:Transmembrane protein n=1 Tax=Hibiscus syriacus TaxID=106335 RepID=A0A6A3B8Z7_HIBSY|nr:putative Transmembrane protein [Hibiscus syriacus]
MADTSSQKLHAIFVAYPLQGHLIPSVNLAIKLASKGFTITFVNTQSVHHQTAKAHPEIGSSDIFASFDRSLNHDQFMAPLLHVFSAHVDELVGRRVGSGEKVHCLIADTFFVWPSKTANKFGLIHV